MSNFYNKPKKLVFWGVLFLVVGFVLTLYGSSGVPGGITIGMGLSHVIMGLNKLYLK